MYINQLFIHRIDMMNMFWNIYHFHFERMFVFNFTDWLNYNTYHRFSIFLQTLSNLIWCKHGFLRFSDLSGRTSMFRIKIFRSRLTQKGNIAWINWPTQSKILFRSRLEYVDVNLIWYVRYIKRFQLFCMNCNFLFLLAITISID